MAKAARSIQLQDLFDIHLQETEAQVERLNECFAMLETTPRSKPCKGMMGLVDEGQDVMAEGKLRSRFVSAYAQ
jgi:Mn-containing catalase